MAQQGSRTLAYGVLRAAGDKHALAGGGLVAIAAMFVDSGGALVASFAAYVTAVIWQVGRPAHWRRIHRELMEQPAPLPATDTLTTTRARTLLRRLAAAQTERQDLIGRSRAGVVDRIAGHLGGFAEIEERALSLVRREDALDRYLSGKDLVARRAAVRRLEAARDGSADARTRGAYDHAITALEEELVLLERMDLARERCLARAEALTATLEMVPVLLAQIESADALDEIGEEVPRAPDLITETLRELVALSDDDRAAVDQVLSEVEPPPAPPRP